jgi:hypothetical protein
MPLKPFDEIVKEATALHAAVIHLPKHEAVHAICDALIRARHDAHVEAIDLMREALEKPEQLRACDCDQGLMETDLTKHALDCVAQQKPGAPAENSAG